MIKNAEETQMPVSLPSPSEQDMSRKPYESPQLRDWGSLLELTAGGLSDITDADFNGGSGGV